MTERYLLMGAAVFAAALMLFAFLQAPVREDFVSNAPPPKPLQIPADFKDQDWLQKINDSPTPVILEFGATWCGPCQVMAPVLDEMESKQAGKVWVERVDVDENPEAARLFEADSIPLLLVIHDGQVVNKLIGVPDGFDYLDLLSMVQPYLAAVPDTPATPPTGY